MFEGDGISYAHARLDDGAHESMMASCVYIEPLLRKALPLIRTSVKSGHGVLVHCNSGMHRSASIACAILMIERGLSLEDAFRHIIRGREVCAPSMWEYLSSPEFTNLMQQLKKIPCHF